MKVKKNPDGSLVAPYTPAMYRKDFPLASVPRKNWTEADLTSQNIFTVEMRPEIDRGNTFQVSTERIVEEYEPNLFREAYDQSPISTELRNRRIDIYRSKINGFARQRFALSFGEDEKMIQINAAIAAAAAWRKANGLSVPSWAANRANDLVGVIAGAASDEETALQTVLAEFDADPDLFFDTYGSQFKDHPAWP